jgi:hypothetical protein
MFINVSENFFVFSLFSLFSLLAVECSCFAKVYS